MPQEFFIVIAGKNIKVTKEIYDAYMRPIWRENKRRDAWKHREWSLHEFQEKVGDIPSHDQLVDEIVEDQMLLETLLKALEILTSEERGLVQDLFFAEKSESLVAAEKGISKQAVNAQKGRILNKLKLFFEKFAK